MGASGFTSVIKIRGVNPFILVSTLRANAIKLGWRKALPVLVRINGRPEKAWRINDAGRRRKRVSIPAR